MQKESNAKYKMILSTSQRLTQNASLLTSLPTYSSISTQFTADFSQLQTVCEQLQINKENVKLVKQNLRKDMADKAFDIMLKVKAYAKITANDLLWSECSFTKSDLYYRKEIDARNKAMIIYNKANANVSVLTSYGVTSTLLTNLKSAIDAYTVAIPTTGYNRADKKDLMLKRDKYITACINYLLKIDALIELLRSSQPTFYLQYKESRRINRMGGSLSLRGRVRDAQTGEFVSGVSISVQAQDQNLVSMRAAQITADKSAYATLVKKRTANKGGFNVKSLPAGVYTISISKYGYESLQQTITVNPGETTNIKLDLTKIV